MTGPDVPPSPGREPRRPTVGSGGYRLGPGQVPGGQHGGQPPGNPGPGAPPPRSGPPGQGSGNSSRLPWIITVVLVILAIIGAILLFTVVKPNPNDSATGVVKAMLSDFSAGKDVDKWRCAQERADRPHDAGVSRELGTTGQSIASYSVQDRGQVRRVSDGTVGTAVEVTLHLHGARTKSLDLFVVEEHDNERVCGIGSLTPGGAG